jgi:hypothetical protein
MSSNVRASQSDQVETTVIASQSRYIDERESRFEAEVSPYSFERSRPGTSIDEKDQRYRRAQSSV